VIAPFIPSSDGMTKICDTLARRALGHRPGLLTIY
jgi:hypothetical protein